MSENTTNAPRQYLVRDSDHDANVFAAYNAILAEGHPGHLGLIDADGFTLAVFAPGEWTSVELVGARIQRTDVAARGAEA